MEVLIIRSNSKSNIKLLAQLAKKMGEKPILEKKMSIMDEIEESLSEVKQMKEGTKPKKTLEDLLNEK
ncbi:MAG: hypothetical protein ACWA6U_12225 [Breznakibacter sp.]